MGQAHVIHLPAETLELRPLLLSLVCCNRIMQLNIQTLHNRKNITNLLVWAEMQLEGQHFHEHDGQH